MKILHVIPAVAPRYGGPSQAIVGIGRALQQRGIEVLIASTDADGPGHLPVELARPVNHQGLPTIFFRRQWSESFKYSLPLARWLAAEVSSFDLVHIHAVFSHACLAAASVCRKFGVPYVVRPLGTLDPWSLQQKRPQKRLLWHFGVERMLRGAAAIHYTTAEEQRLAEGTLGLEAGVVIPLGVDDELLADSFDGEPFGQRFPALGTSPYVLVLSRLHPKKGLELLVEAFLAATADSCLKPWKLVLAGDGDLDYVASLKMLVERRRAGQRVLFPGWLNGGARTDALRSAALMALPSRQENFGLSLVESLAAGVPVLVSPQVNLAADIQAAGAGWVAPLERRALADTLVAALGDNAERRGRGARGRELVQACFTWPAVARQLVALYEAIGSQRGLSC